MEIHTIRSLNVVGTVFFGIFGALVSLYFAFIFSGFFFFMMLSDLSETSFLPMVCIILIVVWIIFIVFLTVIIYRNTVKAIDEMDFERAKRWTLYAAIMGIFLGGGILTFVIFLISYITFDDALRPKFYYPYPPPGYYPPPPPAHYPPPGYPPPGYPPPYR